MIAGGSADARRRPGGFAKAWYALPRFGQVAVPAVAAGDRGQRGPQPPQRPAPGRPGAAGRRGPPLGGRGPVPEAAALAAERRTQLLAAVGRLGESDRQVIACRYFLELSEAEMAAALGLPAGAIEVAPMRPSTALSGSPGRAGRAGGRPGRRAAGGR